MKAIGRALVPIVVGVLILASVVGCPQRAPIDGSSEEDRGPAVTEGPSIDQEPNDTPDEASDLSMGGSGQVGPQDIDYYRTHRSPQLWSLDLLSSSPDAVRVDVIRRGGSLPSTVQPSSRVRLGQSHPDVLVAVRPLGSEPVDYTISLQEVEGSESTIALAEPVDARSPIVVESLPIRMTGYYDHPSDRDAFDVLQSAWPLETPFAVEVSPVAGVRPSLTLLDTGGGVLAEAIAEHEGAGVSIPNIGFSVMVDVRRFEVRNLSDTTPADPYTVSIHAPELPTEYVELEPNNDRGQTNLMTLDATYTGVFHPGDDLDWYRVAMNQPGALTITVVPDATTDIAFEWYPERLPIVVVDSGGPGEPEQACGLAAPTGLHQLQVAARAVAGGTLPRYTLVATPTSGNIEQEPNGLDRPDLVELVTDAIGFVGVAGDVDVFSYRVGITPIDASNVYEFTLESPSGVDTELEIVDAEGGALGASRTEGAGAPERVQVELTRGEYRVVIRGVSGASCDERYTLRVSH